MWANWSLILNVLLLIGVFVAIGRIMSLKKTKPTQETPKFEIKKQEKEPFGDDIISVRRISGGDKEIIYAKGKVTPKPDKQEIEPETKVQEPGETIMLFLLAKKDQEFGGYDLLQIILSAGLRFGDGHIFHLHGTKNNESLCSLAAATKTGVFDLQNIGAFSAKGLCLFMQASVDRELNQEKLEALFTTAKKLAHALDATLLDNNRKPLTDALIQSHYDRLVGSSASATA